MTKRELASLLAKTHKNSPRGEKVAKVILFGITHHKLLTERGIVREIIERAGLPLGYQAEIHKGMRLSNHFKPKKQYQ